MWYLQFQFTEKQYFTTSRDAKSRVSYIRIQKCILRRHIVNCGSVGTRFYWCRSGNRETSLYRILFLEIGGNDLYLALGMGPIVRPVGCIEKGLYTNKIFVLNWHRFINIGNGLSIYKKSFQNRSNIKQSII